MQLDKNVEHKIELYCQIYLRAYERLKSTSDTKEIALRVLSEVAKDLRSELIARLRREKNRNELNEVSESKVIQNGETENKAKTNRDGRSEFATEKQRKLLQELGVDFLPASLTKTEASEIISEIISSSGEEREQKMRRISEKFKGEFKT